MSAGSLLAMRPRHLYQPLLSSWFLFSVAFLFICQCICVSAPLPQPSSAVDYNYRATLTSSKLTSRSTSSPPNNPAPSNLVSIIEDTNMSTQPFLPIPTNVYMRIANATAVLVLWSFDYSSVRPPTLRPALEFAVEVTVHLSPSRTEVHTVPGSQLDLLYTKVAKYTEYTFRVTAQSGETTSRASQSSDYLLGGVSSCPLPVNVRVTAVQSFSVSLAWDKECVEAISDPFYYIKYGSSPEEVHRSQLRLYTSGLDYTIRVLKPGEEYYFCVGAEYQHLTVCSAVVNATTPSVVLPPLATPKISGGLRSITITWAPPSLPTPGVAVYQYNLYYMTGPAAAFDQLRAQRLTVEPGKVLQATLNGLDPAVDYSVAVTYMVVSPGKQPSFWEQESAASRVATAHPAPDAQSFTVLCNGCKALSPEVLRIFWQVVPTAEGLSDLHMTLHISDLLAHQPVVSTEDWAGGYRDVGGLSPWSVHQYGLRLEDQRGYKGRNFTCEPCWTLEEAPSVAPSHLSLHPSGESYNVSWEGLLKSQQHGPPRYQVLVYQCDTATSNTDLSDDECRRCVQHATPIAIRDTTWTSLSLREITHLDAAYAVRVRGVSGGGSLKGPLSPPSCFTTPEGAPNKAPSVDHHIVLGQAVCVEWKAVDQELQFGDVLGYLVNVSEGLPGGDPATFHRQETNVSDPVVLRYLLPDLREGMVYNITVRAYSRAGVGPPSDPIAVYPDQMEQSKTDMELKATHDTSNACSTVTLSWAGQQDGCGSYRRVLEYYVANNGSSTLRTIPVPPNTTYLKLTAGEFSPETEYEFRLKTSYASPSGYTVKDATSDPAHLYIPYCKQLTDQTVITVLSILFVVVAVTILVTLLTLICCHYRRTRLSQRRLRNTPRYHERMRHGQNPYLQYPVHREGSPYLLASGNTSMPSSGSDPDDPPLPLSPRLQHELGAYISLPLNNTQVDSYTRSLSPISMHEIRHLVDREKSPPPVEQLTAPGTGQGALQERHRPVGQSDTTIYGDSTSSDNDSDSDSDSFLLQT